MESETSNVGIGSGLPGPGAPAGNSNRAKQYRIKRTMEKVLAEASSKREGLTRLEAMCKAQIEKAEEGDTQAFREVADRLDGKPVQAVEASVEHSGTITQEHRGIPETTEWLAQTLGIGAGEPQEKPVSH